MFVVSVEVLPDARARRDPMTTVAFIGLGTMGSRMARRLLDAGCEVVAWNRSRARAEDLSDLGLTVAASPEQAAAHADVVITMVTDPPALEEVTQGPAGVAAGVRSGTVVIEMSTVGPAAVSRLASILPDSVGLLDAPVLGSLDQAESGSLTIFAGGPSVLVERATPLLSALGSVIPIGALGSGAAAKLVANATLFATLGSLGEAIALARGMGLSDEVTYRVLTTTPLAAQAERRRRAIETGEYPPRFPLALALKDATLIGEAAGAAGVDVRLTRAAETWLADADAEGRGDHDYSAVLATILDRRVRDRWSARLSSTAQGRRIGRVDCDGLIVDLDGVVWRGEDPIDGAAEALATVRSRGIRMLFLTNEPNGSRDWFASRLTAMGIPASASDVMTSGAATASFVGSLEHLANRRALVIGPPPLHDEIAGAGFELVPHQEARAAELVVVGGHRGFDYAELRAATEAIRNGARLFATGRDAVFPTADGLRPGTGAILAAIEVAGGMPAVVVGKPEPIIFDTARSALTGCERIGVIGDHLIADIAGAKRAGLTAILVLTGATSRDDLDRAVIQPDLVLDTVAALPTVTETPS
jgi:HAD superfamily hydrolase (TIGR01450 family)